MMKQTLGFLALGAATLACSGRYYEVGDMDGAAGVAGTRGAAGGAASGGSSSSTAGVANPGVGAAAGTGTAGPATPAGEQCEPSGTPPKLTGTFAEPAVVWQRISMLALGNTPRTAPTKFPATTTTAWVDTEVTRALQQAEVAVAAGRKAGVDSFLRQALPLGDDAVLAQQWEERALSGAPLLDVLLRTPLDEPGRVGIFTEPAWLATRTTISARGAGIEDVLFARPIPAPPEGFENPEPDPNLSDRANLEAAVASSAACRGCHAIMDPVGFALGHFAADGSFRVLDHGLPVDTASSRGSSPEQIVEFDGIVDFGQKFYDDCQAVQGIAATFVHAAVTITAPTLSAEWALVDGDVERVQQAFVNSDRTYGALVRAYMQSSAGLKP